MRRPFFLAFCRFLPLLLACPCWAGIDGPGLKAPADPLTLKLPAHAPALTDGKAAIPSVVLSNYNPQATPHAASAITTPSAEEVENERISREVERTSLAANANSGACVARQAPESVAAGVRWSLTDGFGVYWQGKGLQQVQRLLGINEINALCPPGDPSPACKTMPKYICN
ncbi:MAG: hypothetical protein JO142_20995 [Burkholderiales bacterium]|nr:hypothetical protein [Burkholderiales bacterium]